MAIWSICFGPMSVGVSHDFASSSPQNVILLNVPKVPKGGDGFLAFGTPSRQISTLSRVRVGVSIDKCIIKVV